MTGAARAGFGRRLAALIYDALLIAALLMVYTAALLPFTHGHAITRQSAGYGWYAYCAGEMLLIGGYCVLNWTRSGQTLGMRAWRLKVVSESGRPLTTARAAARFMCSLAAWMPAALGVLWLYLDPARLALQDRLSGTRVLVLTGS